MISHPWSGRDWWESNSLEFALFKSRDRATKFYAKAKQAAELTRRDALEVFYLCVVMGFRGLYSLPEARVIADQLNLPMSVGQWAQNTAGSLQLRQGWPSIVETPQAPSGAPPLEGWNSVIGSLIVTVLLTIALLTLGFIASSKKSNNGSQQTENAPIRMVSC
jgi:type VI secretion system protein ImpK